MEARFIEIGKERAKKYADKCGVKIDEEFEMICAKASWNWFVADMCDDYSRTLGEQSDIRNIFVKTLVEKYGVDEVVAREATKWSV